jgi:hypothetical protein
MMTDLSVTFMWDPLDSQTTYLLHLHSPRRSSCTSSLTVHAVSDHLRPPMPSPTTSACASLGSRPRRSPRLLTAPANLATSAYLSTEMHHGAYFSDWTDTQPRSHSRLRPSSSPSAPALLDPSLGNFSEPSKQSECIRLIAFFSIFDDEWKSSFFLLY